MCADTSSLNSRFDSVLSPSRFYLSKRDERVFHPLYLYQKILCISLETESNRFRIYNTCILKYYSLFVYRLSVVIYSKISIFFLPRVGWIIQNLYLLDFYSCFSLSLSLLLLVGKIGNKKDMKSLLFKRDIGYELTGQTEHNSRSGGAISVILPPLSYSTI